MTPQSTAAAGPKRLSVAILALGGQGGGVLADWVQTVARAHGWTAQGTSVPGVAQRTGSTVYYVEMVQQGERAQAGDPDEPPVMALMPVPGDVDVVVASELMEAGRAVLRGFSSADRTTLIGSTHRIYAIGEKSGMGDARGSAERILEAAAQRSRRFIGFDMEAVTERAGSVISAIMFGALAGSGALPFGRGSFEDAIRGSGIAVESNLRGFDEGFRAAQQELSLPEEPQSDFPAPTSETGRRLTARIQGSLPEPAHEAALHGVQRLMDYQGAAYAEAYLGRLLSIAALDAPPYTLTAEAARHLALWMSYEDTIRVADLKVRETRMDRVRGEVRAEDDQLLKVTEYMHPRLREVCETLPAGMGRAILGSRALTRLLDPLFRKGRHVETTSLRWYAMLFILSRMRPLRPRSLRYAEEQARIDAWLDEVRETALRDRVLATEIVRCQRLIKGYGDTFERGLRNFAAVMQGLRTPPPGRAPAAWAAELREAALADEDGEALKERLLAA
ncbi:indolepyruvate oxidoreductase subunit B [Pacificimonas flava]|uniref:Indolepyruvate oxidoreductase subunit B n=3 Tax=Sphingosinicellaceae TaxID=2820280 RepID=A0A219B972_9SPHN|nr:indolepyruvate oxidoreductase subunit beta family protein [Pacificimonas aurantium]OWV34714.1 indolepyruvate oxidoreductase subunit B [Pacificimonas flava]